MNSEETFDETLLSAYLDNELEPHERVMVEKELERLSDLRVLLSELSRVRSMVSNCSISNSIESKVISGPWNSGHSLSNADRPFWSLRSARLATMAASIALLFGLGSIVFFPKYLGELVSYNPTIKSPSGEMKTVEAAPKSEANHQDVAMDNKDIIPQTILDMPMASAANSAPVELELASNEPSIDKKSLEVQNGKLEDESVAVKAERGRIAIESMKRQRVEETNLPSLQAPAPSASTKLGTVINSNPRSLGVESQEDSIVQKFAQFVMHAEGSRKSEFGKDQKSDTSKDSLFRFESKVVPQTDERFAFRFGESNGRFDTQTPMVELVIPEANWETVIANLQEKGFSFDSVKSAGSQESEEPILFEATLKKSAEPEWSIRPLRPDRKKWKQSSISQKTSDSSEQRQAVETDSSLRRIYVFLQEEPAKSNSNE